MIQVLDGRSIFHRMHMQYQCEQQYECFFGRTRPREGGAGPLFLES